MVCSGFLEYMRKEQGLVPYVPMPQVTGVTGVFGRIKDKVYIAFHIEMDIK